MKMNHLFNLTALFFLCLRDHGVSSDDPKKVSVMEGDSVTLNTGVQTDQQENITWYYNDVRIAQISGDQSEICTNIQCEDGDERFKDRLDIDNQTGSLNITDIKTEDSGLYHLKIISNIGLSQKIFNVTVHGLFSVGPDKVTLLLMKGDSITFTTSVKADEQGRITWYFEDTRIAQIIGNQRKICADEECKNMDGRFRDRLKMDDQTGSLTITDTRTTDSGLYHLKIISKITTESDKIFSFAIHGVLAADQTKSTNVGESVTLYPSKFKIPHHHMVWYFKDIRIAEITEDESRICTGDPCKERLKDRLKLSIKKGSLTITNTTTEDAGEYKVQINSSRFSIERSFSVSVIAAPDPRLSALGGGAVAALAVAPLLLIVFAAAVICYITIQRKKKKEAEKKSKDEAGQQMQPLRGRH